MIKQGQYKISRALIWGKVGLCRPKMTRDMIKKKKQGFSKNVNLCYKIARKCKIWHFLKITVFTFFIISLVIFGLQRPTLPQIKALEILFWPCFIIFSSRINICWAIMSRASFLRNCTFQKYNKLMGLFSGKILRYFAPSIPFLD